MEALDSLVQQIVAQAQPLRIVLFGSAARGDARADSDLDLLIVMPTGTHRRQTAQQLYCNLNGMGRPFDLVVATEEDLATHGDNPGLVYRSALAEGRILYAA